MIQAENLTKRFGKLYALNNVSCSIPTGKIYGLVGANGAGKSTLLRLFAGIYTPDGGRILLDGRDILDDPVSKNRIVLVPDTPCFLAQSNLVRMADFYSCAYAAFNKKRFLQLCDHFNLPKNHAIRAFSKGMKRLSAILLALCCRPDYLLMDETFDGLDAVIRNEIRNLLYEQIETRGMTAVLSSHSLRELEDTCDQLSLLFKGGLVFESEVQNLKTNLFKLQAAFADPYDKSILEGLDIVSYSQQGKVCSAIIRGDRESAKAMVEARGAILCELLPLRLEEVFVYEMEALGYSFNKEDIK